MGVLDKALLGRPVGGVASDPIVGHAFDTAGERHAIRASEVEIREGSAEIAAIGDSDSFAACSSFGCSEYVITLEDLTNNGDGTATIEVTIDIVGNGLIADTEVEIYVNGTSRTLRSTGLPSSRRESFTVTAGAGDSVEARYRLQNQSIDSGVAGVSATVESIALGPGDVAVTCSGMTSPVKTGDTVTVTFAVENLTSFVISAEIAIFVDGNRGSSTFVSLTGGQLKSGNTLSFTAPSVEGQYSTDLRAVSILAEGD